MSYSENQALILRRNGNPEKRIYIRKA